ncbi:PAAR domain-containing protein [Burkholderia pseudomultivorans]|uniref:PAAR domain-containing protein n=1 Tax=Burkholderia pseudomultivorans TaxID=1207504 RepID=UPI0015839668|nr:PAAR domain-containing protein [Burkholderia pseudomultivorans]
MERYFIRIGDKTTSGGTVLQGKDSFKHHGKAVAYAGAQVSCPACQTVGTIENIPPYRTMLLNGKQIALSDDLCICKCSPAPRLLASQSTGFMSLSGSTITKIEPGVERGSSSASTEPPRLNDRFKLYDHATGNPLVNKEYAILRSNGTVEHGVTDRDGCTHLLSSTTESETVHIYI